MARRERRLLCMSLLLLLLVSAVSVVYARRAKRTIDWDALDRDWEAGDAREELQSRGDEQLAALADKSETAAKALGPQMVFVTLDSAAHTSESVTDLASRWKESLWTGGLDVTVYEIDQGTRLLVALQRGVQVDDLRRFLLAQREVHEIEWDGATFRPDASVSAAAAAASAVPSQQPTKVSTKTKIANKSNKSKKSKTEAKRPTTETTPASSSSRVRAAAPVEHEL